MNPVENSPSEENNDTSLEAPIKTPAEIEAAVSAILDEEPLTLAIPMTPEQRQHISDLSLKISLELLEGMPLAPFLLTAILWGITENNPENYMAFFGFLALISIALSPLLDRPKKLLKAAKTDRQNRQLKKLFNDTLSSHQDLSPDHASQLQEGLAEAMHQTTAEQTTRRALEIAKATSLFTFIVLVLNTPLLIDALQITNLLDCILFVAPFSLYRYFGQSLDLMKARYKDRINDAFKGTQPALLADTNLVRFRGERIATKNSLELSDESEEDTPSSHYLEENIDSSDENYGHI